MLNGILLASVLYSFCPLVPMSGQEVHWNKPLKSSHVVTGSQPTQGTFTLHRNLLPRPSMHWAWHQSPDWGVMSPANQWGLKANQGVHTAISVAWASLLWVSVESEPHSLGAVSRALILGPTPAQLTIPEGLDPICWTLDNSSQGSRPQQKL